MREFVSNAAAVRCALSRPRDAPSPLLAVPEKADIRRYAGRYRARHDNPRRSLRAASTS
jgi:hypothetical protein